MKNLVFIALLLLISASANSQKMVVGVLERAPSNNNRQDYYYTVSSGNGSETGLKQAMDEKLKQNPQYNFMRDFRYTYVGHEGEYYVTIIEFRKKYGVGIGINESESFEEAMNLIKAIFHINSISDYKTLLSKDFSDEFDLPKTELINGWDGPHIGEFGYHYYYKGNQEVVLVKSSERNGVQSKWKVNVGEKDSYTHTSTLWYDFEKAKSMAEEYMLNH